MPAWTVSCIAVLQLVDICRVWETASEYPLAINQTSGEVEARALACPGKGCKCCLSNSALVSLQLHSC